MRRKLHSFTRLLIANEICILSRLSLALDSDGRYGMIGRCRGKACQADAELILLELHVLAAGQQLRGFDRSLQPADTGGFTRPEVDVHIQRVALAGEAGVVAAAWLAQVRVIDALAVSRHPLAHVG